MCKASNKSSLQQQSTTINSRDNNTNASNPNSLNSKKSPEKNLTKNTEFQNNAVKNNPIVNKEINIAQNKCICNVIDNDSLYTNNVCRLCKKSRPDKSTKQQPKKVFTNNEPKNYKDYQQIATVSSVTPNKSLMTKSNSKDKMNVNDLKRLEVKKGLYETNESRNSKNLIQVKQSSNLKSNLNFKEINNDSNNPFKKTTFVTNAQVVNNGNNKAPKEIEIKQSYINNYNNKNTFTKQKYNENSQPKLK